MADEGPVEGAVRSVRTLGGVAFVTLEGGGPQVVCDRQRLGPDGWACCTLLVPGSVARFAGVAEAPPGPSAEGSGPSVQATAVQLLRCHAHPAAVVRVARAVVQGALPAAAALAALQCGADVLRELVAAVGGGEGPEAKAALRRWSLQVARNLAANPVKKRRRPHIAWADRQRLERFAPLAAAFPLSPTAAPAGPPPLAPADHLEPGPSPERCHYCAARKGPQVAWVLNRLQGWLPDGGAGWTVVDVGCGRGDLAVNVAAAYPAAAVVACDLHEQSLEAGRAWAAEVEVRNVRFQRWDARCPAMRAELLQALPAGRALFLGLHACGGLTDVLLDLTRAAAARFLCITCCFTFHADLRVGHPEGQWWGLAEEDGVALCRLAEMQGDDAVAQRAMHIVNGLRLRALRRQLKACPPQLEIITFPVEMSPKNQALVGFLKDDAYIPPHVTAGIV